MFDEENNKLAVVPCKTKEAEHHGFKKFEYLLNLLA